MPVRDTAASAPNTTDVVLKVLQLLTQEEPDVRAARALLETLNGAA